MDLMSGLSADESDRIAQLRLLGLLPTPEPEDLMISPATNRDRRRIQRAAMAGREPSAMDQTRLAADQPRLEENSRRLLPGLARQAVELTLPGFAISKLSEGLLPTPVETAEVLPGAQPATDDQLQEEARRNAERAAREPSLFQRIGDEFKGLIKGRDFNPPDFETFRSRRVASEPPPRKLSETEYVQQQAEAYRKSPAYQALVKDGQTKMAENRVRKIEEDARNEFGNYLGRYDADVKRYNTNIKDQYKALKGELESQKDTYNSQSFSERNPIAAGVLTYGPLVLGGLAARKAFKTYNDQGQGLLDAAKTARSAGDTVGERAAQEALKDWSGPGYWGTVGKTAAKTGIGTIAGRGLMDLTDQYLMPKGSGAQTRAQEKWLPENLPTTLLEYGKNAALGAAEGPAIGAMMTKGGPRWAAEAEIKRIDPNLWKQADEMNQRAAQSLTNQSGLSLQRAQGDVATLTAQQQAIALQKQLEAMQAAAPPGITFANQRVTLPPPNLPGSPRPPAGPIPPANNGGPPAAGGGGGGPVPPPIPPPGGAPGSPGQRPVYGTQQQALVRPYIEGEVSAGRNVPDRGGIEQLLSSNGTRSQMPKNLDQRLDNAQAIVQNMRAAGVPDQQIAVAIRRMMDEGKLMLPGLAAVAGLGAAATQSGDLMGPAY